MAQKKLLRYARHWVIDRDKSDLDLLRSELNSSVHGLQVTLPPRVIVVEARRVIPIMLEVSSVETIFEDVHKVRLALSGCSVNIDEYWIVPLFNGNRIFEDGGYLLFRRQMEALRQGDAINWEFNIPQRMEKEVLDALAHVPVSIPREFLFHSRTNEVLMRLNMLHHQEGLSLHLFESSQPFDR